MSKLSERLREIRAENHLSVSKASEAFGLSYATWSTWENEKSRPNVDLVSQICARFNVCASWLLGETDYRTLDEVRASGNATANGDGAVAAVVNNSANTTVSAENDDKARIRFLEAQLETASKEKAKLLDLLARLQA